MLRERFGRDGGLGQHTRPAQDLADRQRAARPVHRDRRPRPPSRARPLARDRRRGPTAPAAARVSEIRHSTLPRFNSARMRSRSAASRPRNSSGRRSWTSRNRWLTERSSTESATPGSSAATAAKPVMLTIIAETRRIQAIFATLLWAPSSGECMRYLLHAQARERPLACELQASSADNRHPMQPCPSPIKPSQAGTSC